MHSEIAFAVAFVVRMLGKGVSEEARRVFSASLTVVLQERFVQAAWDPQRPILGSAFRCLRSEAGRIDPLLARAASTASIPTTELPSSLTLWVDPGDVSARIGAEGSLFSVLEGAQGHQMPATSNAFGSSSSSAAAASSAPSLSAATAPSPSSPGKLSPTATPGRPRGLRSLAITERPTGPTVSPNKQPSPPPQQQQQHQQQHQRRMMAVVA